MEIVDIKYKKCGSAVLTLADDSKIELCGDDVYALNLKKGAVLTQDAVLSVREMGDDYFAYKKAVSAVAAGDVSRAGLMQKLVQKGAKRKSAERAVAKIEEMGFIDEAAYAARLCETYGLAKHLGKNRVLQELYAHGIPRDTAVFVADTVLPPDSENILQYWQAKLSKTDLGSKPAADKAYAALVRAGYGYDTASAFLRRVKAGFDDNMQDV